MLQSSVTWLKSECRAIKPLKEIPQLISEDRKLNTPSESQFRTTIRILDVFPNMGSSTDLLMASLWGVRWGHGWVGMLKADNWRSLYHSFALLVLRQQCVDAGSMLSPALLQHKDLRASGVKESRKPRKIRVRDSFNDLVPPEHQLLISQVSSTGCNLLTIINENVPERRWQPEPPKVIQWREYLGERGSGATSWMTVKERHRRQTKELQWLKNVSWKEYRSTQYCLI